MTLTENNLRFGSNPCRTADDIMENVNIFSF